MKNIPRKNQKIFKLSLVLSLSLLTFSASAQEAEVLKRAGINVVNGFNLPGSPERVNTIRGNMYNQEQASVGDLPANKTIQGDPNQEETSVASETYEQYNRLHDTLNSVGKNSQNALDKISEKTSRDVSNGQNNPNMEKKKITVAPKKQIGPIVQEVGISNFNQETLKEMEAYGKAREQQEYLKFRMEANQHKNPPVQIRKP